MAADVIIWQELQSESGILSYLLQHATLIGRDAVGRSIISLPLNDWLLDQLATLKGNTRSDALLSSAEDAGLGTAGRLASTA
ncbi:MAG TPA: hypothetical protein VHI72_10305 [Hyphomicrobiaceae bacterium]|nr:hypothetical protein [Hyphomicrobiaceae bacterium]